MMKSITGFFFILLCAALLTIGGCSKQNDSPDVSPSKEMKQKMKAFNKKFQEANERFENSVNQESESMFPDWAKPHSDSLASDSTNKDSVAYCKTPS